jgi:hypothetical protein
MHTPDCPAVPSAKDARPLLEVADVIRLYGDRFRARYGKSLSLDQRRAFLALSRCRTAALGGHVCACDHCGVCLNSYNSCRNRHCPKCQAGVAAAWLERECQLLLPIEYHHVVFTLPHELGPLALQNSPLVYELLFQAVAGTLRQIAADPKHLGAEIGVVAVLHTWGQTMQHHPHIHCVASGGGLALDADGRRAEPARWLSCPRGFFLPVRVLSEVYRGKFLDLLRSAHAAEQLQFHGELADLAEPTAFAALLKPLYAKDWVVNSQPAGGPEVVLKYLARYVRRVAISNSRLVSMADGKVTFTWKDYAHEGKQRQLPLAAEEFLRRFFQHVLPKGFHKVRHYGFLVNGQRKVKLDLCRALLALLGLVLAVIAVQPAAKSELRLCPECGVGHLHQVEEIPRPFCRVRAKPKGEDSS